MLFLRTVILLILWVGLMAGASSAVLDGNNRVFFYFGVFILGWLTLKFLLGAIRVSSPRQLSKPSHRFSRREIEVLRKEYDAQQRKLSIATSYGEDVSFFDSYGHKRDALTGEYLYMNLDNAPNGDVFADYPKE